MPRAAISPALAILGYLVAVILSTLLLMFGVNMLSAWNGASAGTAELVRVGIAVAVSACVIHTLVREKEQPNDEPETHFG